MTGIPWWDRPERDRQNVEDRNMIRALYSELELPFLQILSEQVVVPVAQTVEDHFWALDNGFGVVAVPDNDAYYVALNEIDEYNADEETGLVERLVHCGVVVTIAKAAQLIDSVRSIMRWENPMAKAILMDFVIQVVGQIQEEAEPVIHPQEEEDDGDQAASVD